MIKKSLYITAAAYLGIILVLFTVLYYLNESHFIYVLDDPYIHMTIAKHFSTSGQWALNGLTFSSATSSPLWTLLISLIFFFTGPAAIIPFILNIIFGILAAYAAYRILLSFYAEKYILPVLLTFTFASALPALAFTGMEHSAQIFFSLIFIFLIARTAVDEKSNIITLIIVSAVLTGLRYEDLFLIFSASIVLTLRKKYAAAFLIFTAGLTPIIIYGLISESHGWMFLPNPILIKSRVGDLTITEVFKIPLRAARKMLEPDIVFLLPGMIYTIYKNYKVKIRECNKEQIMFFVFLLSYILHMLFAQTGWFFRYEAYLTAIGIIIFWLNIYKDVPIILTKPKWYVKTVLALVLLSLAARGLTFIMVPPASNNIYTQHYQMQRFVNVLPPETVIAANDIGMLNFYTSNYIVDLWGLADTTAARHRLNGNYSTAAIDSLTKQKNVKLVIVYKEWFDQFGGLPAGWKMIYDWKMNTLNIVNGNETVTFYSLDRSKTSYFEGYLEKFSKGLPNTDTYKFYK